MKRLILLFALALFALQPVGAQLPAPVPPPAQTEGFLGIPWGSSVESVKKEFAARSHARLDRGAGSADELQFIGGKFAGLKVSKFYLHFAADHFWKADAVFEAVSKDHLKEFATLRQLLVEKFGPLPIGGRDQDTTVEWYLHGPPGLDKDKVNLTTEPRGSGMKLFYAADRVRRAAAEPPKAAEPVKKVQTLPVAPKARDDL